MQISSETATEAGSVKGKSPFEEISDKITAHNDCLSVVVERVNEAVNQISGPQPPHPAEEKPDEPPSDNFIAKIAARLAKQESIIEQLQSAVRRLSPLL